MAIDPAKCPPGTDTPVFAARILGPISLPLSISSLILASMSRMPPTVLRVVTPLMSSVFAYPAFMRFITACTIRLPESRRNSFL